MRALALCLALSTGCMAQYAVQSRHDQPRKPTPTWRVGVDMSIVLASGVVFGLPQLDNTRWPWVPYGIAGSVLLVDLAAVIATGSKD